MDILIVEDNARFRNMLKFSIGERFPSARVSTAAEGTEALGKIAARKPDLIFMDVRMPGKSGLVLTREIKMHNPDIVIIILTNMDTSDYRDAAFASGADFFLSKESVQVEEIQQLVERIIARIKNQSESVCSDP